MWEDIVITNVLPHKSRTEQNWLSVFPRLSAVGVGFTGVANHPVAAQEAKTWSASKAPAKFDTPKIQQTLAKLTTESQALAKLVKADAGDEQIKKSLTALHDRFHEIVELCNDHGSH